MPQPTLEQWRTSGGLLLSAAEIDLVVAAGDQEDLVANCILQTSWSPAASGRTCSEKWRGITLRHDDDVLLFSGHRPLHRRH